MRIRIMKRRLLALLTAVAMLVAFMPAMVFAEGEESDYRIDSASFDESYRVLDDIEETDYKEYYYFVPYGTVLEPIVKDTKDNIVSGENYIASYTEMKYIPERYEWNMIDENNWSDEFPSKPGVYFCKVEGVDPYTGSFEWIDLIRILEPEEQDEPLDDELFNEFFKVAGWFEHDLLAGKSGFSFTVPCSNYDGYFSKEFTKDDLDKIKITVSTADGKVYEPDVKESPDFPGDYVYTYDTPALDWGAAYTINFQNGDTVKKIKGVAKKSVKLTYTVSNLTYTGKTLTPKITIKYGKSTLVKGKDYVLDADMGILGVIPSDWM